MSRSSSFRMVLAYSEESVSIPGDWVVSVTLVSPRRGASRLTFTCENIATGEMLRHPQDYDRMIAVLPVEYWPRFITDLTPDSPAQDALFSAGKE